MGIKESSADRLRRLLREELKDPFTRVDQINTVIWNDFIDASDVDDGTQQLIDALIRQLSLDPTLITALSRAVNEENGSDWIDLVSDALPEDSSVGMLVDFVDVAREAANDRLTELHGGVDQKRETTYKARLWMQAAAKGGSRTGSLCLDFQSIHSPVQACYDRTAVVAADYPGLLLQLLCAMPSIELTHAEDRRKPVALGPMYRYHPERMRASRAYLKRLPAWGIIKGQPAGRDIDFQACGDALTQEIKSTHTHYTIRDQEKDGPITMTTINQEMELAATWLAYVGAGREIFDIPSRLADMFSLSDCDDIRLEQVFAPYKGQYIHFGARKDLPLSPGWLCDGAYVLADQGCITVRLTSMPEDPSELMDWRVRAEPIFRFKFLEQDQQLDVGTAVDTAIARELGELRAESANAAQRQRDADAAIEELGVSAKIKVVTAERVDRETESIMSSRDVGHRALSMIVNALCYLTAYPGDVEHRWPESAPETLVKQLDGGTPGKRKRAEQQLHGEGFSKVRLCGRAFRALNTETYAVGAGSVRSHWRRGHFRSQAHGQGRQLRKLVWIMPILVNAATMKEDTQLPGHLYIVEDQLSSH